MTTHAKIEKSSSKKINHHNGHSNGDKNHNGTKNSNNLNGNTNETAQDDHNNSTEDDLTYLHEDTRDNPFSKSVYTHDVIINTHPRFGTLTRNIRTRRGNKVDIRIPVHEDFERTYSFLKNELISYFK